MLEQLTQTSNIEPETQTDAGLERGGESLEQMSLKFKGISFHI